MPGAPTAGLHWWTAATSHDEDSVQAVLGPLAKRETPGGYGHPFKRVHESGTAVYCGSSRPDQPLVLNAPGEVCEGWSRELLDWSQSLEAWCTRCDLALDVEPAELARARLIELHDQYKSGRCNTTMRRASCVKIESDKPGDGWTLYLGGKTSELLVRVYDRRGPLRIEPQWRPARKIGRFVPELLATRGATHVWRMLARRVEFQAPWYRELLTGPELEREPEQRPSSTFADALQQLRQQFGITIWALESLGVTLGDLARPPERLRGSQAAKLMTWARQAEALGYDGKKLRGRVRRRCE